MNLATFRVQFPEFKAVADTFVQAHLDAAELEVDADVWGTKADQGIAYLAAHKMALSPMGQAAKLVNPDPKKGPLTTYHAHYLDLVRQVSSGFRTA